MFMRNRLARKMAAEMRGATCAGTQTSKAPTLSGPSVTNHYSVLTSWWRYKRRLLPLKSLFILSFLPFLLWRFNSIKASRLRTLSAKILCQSSTISTVFLAEVSLESFPRKTTENLKEFRGILETSAEESGTMYKSRWAVPIFEEWQIVRENKQTNQSWGKSVYAKPKSVNRVYKKMSRIENRFEVGYFPKLTAKNG